MTRRLQSIYGEELSRFLISFYIPKKTSQREKGRDENAWKCFCFQRTYFYARFHVMHEDLLSWSLPRWKSNLDEF